MGRQNITVSGRRKLAGSVLPEAVRLNGWVFTSAITGADPVTGKVDSDPEVQIRQAFINLERFLEGADLRQDDVAMVTMYMRDLQDRRWVNAEWVKLFPDAENRPARHAVNADLSGFNPDYCIQLLVVAAEHTNHV